MVQLVAAPGVVVVQGEGPVCLDGGRGGAPGSPPSSHPSLLCPGATVILTTKGIDDTALKYFVEAGAIAARRVPKDDLRWARVGMGG